MGSERVVWIFVLLALREMVVGMGGSSASCDFPAVYNFGDSNSDTGQGYAAFGHVPSPNGETFFGKPSGRLCDGRLIIDFIAESLGLPFLNAFLDSIGTNFRHGANFATGGASIRSGGFSPFDLGVQVSQFIRFKSRITQLYEDFIDSGMINCSETCLPNPGEFSEALYTIDIGQNDLSFAFRNMTEDQIRASIPDMLLQFTQAVQQLYNEGARFFWVHNTGPVGCLPSGALQYKAKNGSLDQYGCIKYQNDIAQEFNQQLKNSLSQLKAHLPLAKFTYVDVYSAKFSLIRDAKNQGFDEPLNFCCGSLFPDRVFCGSTEELDGTLYGKPCDDPWARISWDGVHHTEAANRWIAAKIISGALSDPPVPIINACSWPTVCSPRKMPQAHVS